MSSNSECKLRFALPGTLGMRLGGGCGLRHRSPLQGVHRRLVGNGSDSAHDRTSPSWGKQHAGIATSNPPCTESSALSRKRFDIRYILDHDPECLLQGHDAARRGSPRATLRRHRKGRPTQARATGCRRDDGLPRGTTGKSTRGAQGTSPWTGARTPDSPRQCRGHVPIRHESSGPLDRNMIRRCRRPVFVSRWSGSRTPHCFVRIRGVFRGAGTTP